MNWRFSQMYSCLRSSSPALGLHRSREELLPGIKARWPSKLATFLVFRVTQLTTHEPMRFTSHQKLEDSWTTHQTLKQDGVWLHPSAAHCNYWNIKNEELQFTSPQNLSCSSLTSFICKCHLFTSFYHIKVRSRGKQKTLGTGNQLWRMPLFIHRAYHFWVPTDVPTIFLRKSLSDFPIFSHRSKPCLSTKIGHFLQRSQPGVPNGARKEANRQILGVVGWRRVFSPWRRRDKGWIKVGKNGSHLEKFGHSIDLTHE